MKNVKELLVLQAKELNELKKGQAKEMLTLTNKQRKELAALEKEQKAAKKKMGNRLMKDYKEIVKSLEALGMELPTVTVEKIVEIEKTIEVPVIKEVKVASSNDEEIKRLQAEVAKYKEMARQSALDYEKANKTIEKLREDLNSQKAMYNSLLASQQKKEESKPKHEPKQSQAKVHVEQEIKSDLPESLVVKKNYDSFVIGTYKGVAFEACKHIDATTIYDPTQWNLKNELNNLLVSEGFIDVERPAIDPFRVECSMGSCHEISKDKFMGYVIVDNYSYCYVFDKAYDNGKGNPTYIGTKTYLKNAKVKFNMCRKKNIIASINVLLDKHIENKIALSTVIAKKSAATTPDFIANVTSNCVANGVITSDPVVNGVTTPDYVANITSNSVVDGVTTSDCVVNGVITSNSIANGVITSDYVATGVTTSNCVANITPDFNTATDVAVSAATTNPVATTQSTKDLFTTCSSSSEDEELSAFSYGWD